MNRIYRWLAILFCCAAPPWYSYVIFDDCTHPELWGDPMHNPNLYLPALAVLAMLGVGFIVHVYRTERKSHEHTKNRP